MIVGISELLREFIVLFGYISNTKAFPKPLSKEQELQYIIQMNNGDECAKNKLIEHNLRLVAHISKKYSGNCQVDTDDLISIGTIGLIKGISSFDSFKKTSIASYTSRCIENEILMFLRSNKKNRNEAYLEDSIGNDKEGNSIKLMDIICHSDEGITSGLETKMYIEKLNILFDSKLTNREKQILAMRFGLNNQNQLTQNKIAQELNISRSYVSRIEKNALEKLRKYIDK